MKVCTLVLAGLVVTSGGWAQTGPGTHTRYVSEQQPGNTVIGTGGAVISASEGRVIDVEVFNVSGPITVTPMGLNLTGPPCPVYDYWAQRVGPAVPDNTVSASGTVELTSIPPAGSITAASLSVRDNGYYTKCLAEQLAQAQNPGAQVRVGFPDVYTVDFQIISIKVDIPDTLPCPGDTVTLTASTFPSGGVLTWTTPGGTFTGNNVSYAVTSAPGPQTIIALYELGGAAYADTGILDPSNLSSFSMPYCVNSVQATKPVATVGFSGMCEPGVVFNPDTLKNTFGLPIENVEVSATSGVVSLTDSTKIVNKGLAVSITPIQVGDTSNQLSSSIRNALGNYGLPCALSGSLVPNGQLSVEIFPLCCNDSIIWADKLTGSLNWGAGVKCTLLVSGVPVIGGFNAILIAGVGITVSASTEQTCTVDQICGTVGGTFTIGGGAEAEFAEGAVSLSVVLVVTGAGLTGTFCKNPDQRTYKVSTGQVSIVGTVSAAYGFVSHSVSYVIWTGWSSPDIPF